LIPDRVPIPSIEPQERVCSFDEYILLYSKERAIEEAKRCIQCARPWCVEACPIEQDCRLYLKQIAEGDFEGAVGTILRDNPLASCLGKVCYSYCEQACVIGKRGEPVAIRYLKWAALAYGSDSRQYEPEGRREGSIAVVGAGPAGLTAAWWLAKKGYKVTVFEASNKLGGLVTQTIPPYRLSHETFEDDLRRLEPLGIEFKKGVAVGRDLRLEDLLTRGFDAVFVGIGTHKPRRLRVPGEDLPGVYIALDFLKNVFDGKAPPIGGTVATIGGGDVAMDCARTVLRLGAEKSIILYRRTREEMPASEEELEDAIAEGVDVQFLVSPVEFRGTERVEAVVVQKMELGPPDESGRRRPVPIEGQVLTVPVDYVIVAIGQEADLEGFQDLGLKTARDGSILADPETCQTSMEGVFAGGGPSIVHAMAAGRKAAEAIIRYLEERAEATIAASRR
jgi:NADPH-dependent glutamate synthase beta subunit-like oxidoreductase